MYRSIQDFVKDWSEEIDAMRKTLAALTDKSLGTRVTPEGRSLGQLAWHLTLTLPEMLGKAGFPVEGPAEDAPVPSSARIIEETYLLCAEQIERRIAEAWTDSMLEDDLDMYGMTWKRKQALQGLIMHQVHHRGQMTVLMRQAGLKVPGLFGPSREEWAQWNMPAPW